MQRNECLEFEKAVYADSAIGPELQRHLRTCARCGALSEAVGLSVPRLVTAEADPFAESVIAAATQISRKRAESSERRRKAAPLLVGAAGYLIAIGGLVLAAVGNGSGSAAPAPLTAFSLPPLPAPDPLSIAAVLLGSMTVMVIVAFLTRGHQALSA